jgi:site-specific DNA recombinase
MELAGVVGSVEDFCERVRSGLANTTFEHRRKLVELLIDRVIVTDEEVEIRYVIPTTPESEHVRFCHLRSDYLHYPTPADHFEARGDRVGLYIVWHPHPSGLALHDLQRET